MAAMVTDQSGRLIAYTCQELAAHTWVGVNALPYGISRAFAAATNSAAARDAKMKRAQSALERIDIVAYSALETAINNLDKAADSFLAATE